MGHLRGCRIRRPLWTSFRQHTSAYVSIRQHTSAYGALTRLSDKTATLDLVAFHSTCIRQHTSAYASIRQHTSVSIRQRYLHSRVSRQLREREHTSAYASICQHTSAYVSVTCIPEYLDSSESDTTWFFFFKKERTHLDLFFKKNMRATLLEMKLLRQSSKGGNVRVSRVALLLQCSSKAAVESDTTWNEITTKLREREKGRGRPLRLYAGYIDILRLY
jgi:hypothetical protein